MQTTSGPPTVVATAPADAGAAPAAAPPPVWRGMLTSGGTRLLVLPVSALLGILVTRIVIEEYGTAAFAQYGLLVGIAALLPFADLGLSAAVVRAVSTSTDPAHDPEVRRVFVSTLRVLVCSASVMTVLALGIWATGSWSALLGPGLLSGPGPLAATLCLLLIAVTLPLGFGQRLLTGLGRNHVAVAIGGLQTPIVLGAVLLVVWADLPAGPYIAVFAYVASLLLALACALYGARVIRPVLGDAVREALHLRSVRGARVFDVAGPMLVQMVALPLAMQSDRLVLSHRAGADVLAEYNLAAQVFTPIWAVVSAAGITLWPVYQRRRASGRDESPLRMSLFFGAAAGLASIAMAVASPWLADLATGGAITLGWGLVAAFTVLMTLQGLKYPAGMYLTDPAGLRFQALMTVLMLPLNVGISWWAAGRIGAAGVVLGSVVGVLTCQVVANALYVRHVRARRATGLRGAS